ncbi:MAG: shikimate dehydrogenase [Puniceicoccaceae bacterium]|nr:MAG: shikimate dehydrogenase [Puniceicoccaceae bacterium]
MNPEAVLTLADLRDWSFSGTALAVLGHPIAHSLSPPMHNAALAAMAACEPRFASWRYFRFDIPPERLAEALPRFHQLRFHGLNLTVPHKTIAVPEVAKIDSSAAGIGAVNTLQWEESGYTAFNTDGHGLETGVREDLGRGLGDGPVILLGAGGAARAAALECLRRGCPRLAVGNRNPERLAALLRLLTPEAESRGARLDGFELTRPRAESLPADALVINATSLGLRSSDPPPADPTSFPGAPRFYDMIYNPAETPLLARARTLGRPAANGLSMLVHQGARALEIWSGATVPAGEMRRAAGAALAAAP